MFAWYYEMITSGTWILLIKSIDWSFTKALMQKFAMLECIGKFYKKFSKWKISYFK